MDTRIHINITHIVNPTQFYYVKEDDLLNNDNSLELELQKFFRQNNHNSPFAKAYAPKLNEIVAVFNISEKRWVRAVIDHIYNFAANGPKFILWALDYGKPIVSNGKFIRPLPTAFQNYASNDIFLGGINNLVPAETGFDYLKMTPKLEICNKWSLTSCEIFEKLKESSEQCHFTIEEECNGQFFGQLEVVNCLNIKSNLKQLLCKANLALECYEIDFLNKVKKFQLNKTKRWLSPNGDCKLLNYPNNYGNDIENNLPSQLKLDSEAIKNDTELDSNICNSLKIKDWKERNKRILTSSENKLNNFKISHNDEIDSMSNLDSVSVIEEQNLLVNLRNMKIDKFIKNDEVEDDIHSEFVFKMKQGGSNLKYRKDSIVLPKDDNFSFITKEEKPKFTKLSELSISSDFQVDIKPNDENQSIVSGSSIISQQKYLAERRNKLLGKIQQQDEIIQKSNDETYSIISDSSIPFPINITEQKHKSKTDLITEKKKIFIDTNNSIISDSSISLKQKYLAERKNKILSQKPTINATILSNTFDSLNNTLESDSLKLLIEQEHLDSPLKSDASDFSLKSREKFLADRKTILRSKIKSNEVFTNTVSVKNQHAANLHHVASTKPAQLCSETIQNNENKKLKGNLQLDIINKSTTVFSTSAVSEKTSNGGTSINNSMSHASANGCLNSTVSKQKSSLLNEKNQRIVLPAGYNVPCLKLFKNENEVPKLNTESKIENQTLPKQQNIMKNNKTKNTLSIYNTISRKNNTERIKLEEINEVCISDVSDYSKNLVLVHGTQIWEPVYKLEKVEFTPIVHRGMQQLVSNSSVYRIQQYSWPNILKGKSLVIINSAQTGKTYSYLPAICSLIHMVKEDEEVTINCGPICIIVASTRKDATNLRDKCKHLISNQNYNDHIVLFDNPENEDDFKKALKELFEGKDILICTPQCLNRLFSQKLKPSNSGKEHTYLKWFSKERLKYFVIENYDLWDDEKRNILLKYIKKLKLVTTKNLQMVVTSNIWDKNLEFFFKLNCFVNSLLCIGSHIEAAVYGGTHFSLKIVPILDKVDSIREFIAKFTEERLIVVCATDEEANNISEELQKYFLCVKLTYENSSEEIGNFSNRWKNGSVLENEILICTDEQLNVLKIQNAKNLIHYSLSNSWSKFSLRFSVLIDSYVDRVNLNFAEKSAKPPRSLILLDEHNDDQLPKLIKFLERINCVIPLNIKELSLKKEQEIENRKTTKNFRVCTKFLEFGKYHQKENCNIGRHALHQNDESYNNIPEKGIIKYDIINIFSPVCYSVRILNYKSSISNNWMDYNKASKYAAFSFKFMQHFSNSANHIRHLPAKLYDICVIADDNNFYRAQIIRIIKASPYSYTKTDNIECKLLDEGKIEIYPINCLLYLPYEFQEFPYQAIDLRLTGIISVDKEDEWDEHINKIIVKWLKHHEFSNPTYFTSQIEFTILNTLFVPEIVLSETFSDNISIHRVFVKKKLLKKNLALRSGEVTENLKASALSLKILRESKKEENDIIMHLDDSMDRFNKKKILANNENNKNDENIIENSLLSNRSDIDKTEAIVTNSLLIDLSKTPMSGNRARPIRGLRNISLKYKEIWCNFVDKQYTEVVCSSYCNPNEFYVIIKENEYQIRQKKLYDKIDRYLAKQPEPIIQPEIGINCIGKFRKDFERCKIVEIIYDPKITDIRVKVFFVDCGFIGNRSIQNLFLSTKEIIEYLPYQAICCKLIGGIWYDKYAHNIYDELIEQCEYLCVLPIINEEEKLNSLLKNPCYGVILLDCTTRTLINKKIIELGYGEEDPQTKHFLEIEKNYGQLITDNDENWDDENTGKIFEYKPSNDEINLDLFNNEEGEERVFDVNFELDELKEFLRIPKTAKFLEIENKGPNLIKKFVPEKEKLERKKIQRPGNKDIENKFENSRKEKQNSLSKEKIDGITDLGIPKLMQNINRPFVIWKQSEDYIRLEISAPDINDYHLNVTKNHLYFAAIIQTEPKQLDIKFFGDVRPDYTFHEIRGLNVVIALIKVVNDKRFMWPRLTETNEKNVLIKYDENAISDLIQDEDTFVDKQVDLPIMNYTDSSEDDDMELVKNELFTDNQIFNEEDDHDPFADGF